jgi:hypothetical protein
VARAQVEQVLRRGAIAEQRRGGTDGKREHEVGAGGVAEEQLGHAERDVVGAHLQDPLGVALGVEGEVVVQMHRGLGFAGRARGEQPHRRIVSRRVVVGQRRRCATDGVAPVSPGADDAAQEFVARDQRRDAIGQTNVGDQGARACVLEVVLVVAVGQLRVHHGDDGADLEPAEERGDELDRIGQADEHAIFDADAERAQRVAHLIGQRLHLAIAVATVVVDDGDVIAAALLDTRVEEVVRHVEALGESGRLEHWFNHCRHWFDHFGAVRRRRPVGSSLTSGSSSATRSHSLQVTCLWRWSSASQ